MSDVFELQGFDNFYDLLANFPEYALKASKPAMEQALLTLHDAIPEYPDLPKRGEYVSPLVSLKQRRWFFAAVKKGEVPGWEWVEDEHGGHPEGHYRRTGTLGRQITEETRVESGAVVGEIGLATPYAPWVIGPDYPGETINGQTMYQARIHQDRWWQFQDIVDQNIQAAWDEFARVFFQEFDLQISGR